MVNIMVNFSGLILHKYGAFWSTFDGKLNLEEGEHFCRNSFMDWAGFEPATSRLRSEHYYP
jgi:hypothetical protein